MSKPRGRPVANQPKNLPAPVNGIDAVSALMAMKESSAVLMENWRPFPDGLRMRTGSVNHVTGFANPIKRLHVYASPTGGESLWATTSAGVYNATLAGAVGAASIALTDGHTIAASISTGAGNYLLLVNGVDTAKQYDGTTWSSIATFGATSTVNYSYIEIYRQRVFLAKRNSLEIEYLAVNSIAGAATNYPLGAVFRQGGYIVALGTWTIDGGTGPEDNLAILTNKGEVAVYSGADPATWSLKGVYSIGRPLGQTPCYKYGGDLLIITETGVYPLSAAIQTSSIDRTQPVTGRIQPILTAAAQSFSNSEGWQIIADPLTSMLLINIPSSPIRKQAVMHSQTGAWTLFSGLEANYFARMAQEVYFCTDTTVLRINGVSDNGTNITATCLQAYTRLGYPRNKQIELVKPYFNSDGGYTYSLGVATSFIDQKELTTIVPLGGLTAALWGTAIFGAAMWTGMTEIAEDWQTVPDEFGLWKGLYFQVVSNNGSVFYYGSDLLFIPGGDF